MRSGSTNGSVTDDDPPVAIDINDALPNEILWTILLFAGGGRMPCIARMVCRRWHALGANCRPARLLPVEIADWLHPDLDVAALIARAALLMHLVGTTVVRATRKDDVDTRPTAGEAASDPLECICIALGAVGRWQHIVALVERAPCALNMPEQCARVASGAIAIIPADDALGRLTAGNTRLSVLCGGLCSALAAGHATATRALCARLATFERARDTRCTARVDAATTTAARRGHVDAVLAQSFCTAHNVAIAWDAVVSARDSEAFGKLVNAVKRAGPEAMNAARHASWTSRRSAGAAQANLGALALGWYGGGWTHAAAAAGWDTPFVVAMDDAYGNDMALAVHHPYRRSLSSLWADAASTAMNSGHSALAARLAVAATLPS